MKNEKRGRKMKRQGEERRGRKDVREETVHNNLWYKSIFHASGEGLTSDDPFFSRAQPYA